MLKCFKYEGGRVTISQEALLIKEFKDLWDRDQDQAMKEMSYIYLLNSYDPANPFSAYADDIRKEKVEQNVWGKKYKPDKLVKAAQDKFIELRDESAAMRLLISTQKAMDKLSTYLNGATITDPQEAQKIMSLLKSAPDTAKALKQLEESVKTEQFEKAKTRASRAINHFEK